MWDIFISFVPTLSDVFYDICSCVFLLWNVNCAILWIALQSVLLECFIFQCMYLYESNGVHSKSSLLHVWSLFAVFCHLAPLWAAQSILSWWVIEVHSGWTHEGMETRGSVSASNHCWSVSDVLRLCVFLCRVPVLSPCWDLRLHSTARAVRHLLKTKR